MGSTSGIVNRWVTEHSLPNDLPTIIREYCAARRTQRSMADALLPAIDAWIIPVIRKMIWNPEDQEDVYQDAIARILVNLERFDSDRPL